MKLTFLGLTLSSSWGNGHATPLRAIIRALHRLGHRITFYEKELPFYAAHRDFSASDHCQLVLYSDWKSIRDAALRDAADSDIVITTSYLPEGARIHDEVLPLNGPLHIFYDLDTPVTLNALRRGPIEYLRPDQIPQFDLYLSFTGGRILSELRNEWGAQAVAPLYGCVDPDMHHRVEVPEAYRCWLSYMGTFAVDRQAKLEELFLAPARELPGRKFVLAGSMFTDDIAWPPNLWRFPHVGPNDHAALYSSSRATLNITRAEMVEYGYCPSGRLFEAAACSTPLLSDEWLGIEEFFADGNEISIVRNRNDVISALQRADKELERVAERARERTLDQHTGRDRAQQLLQAAENCRNRNFVSEAAR